MAEGSAGSIANAAWGLPTRRSLIAVYLGLSTMLVLVHSYHVNFNPRHLPKRIVRHQEIVSNTGKTPYVYRVLVPHVAEALSPVFRSLGAEPFRARELAYGTLRWMFIAGALLLFHALLRTWFEPPWAIAGVFLFAALHPASFYFYWYQPASSLDLLLWLLAALMSLRGRAMGWLVPLTILGAFNRETIVFVSVIHFALRYGREPTSALLARCTAIFAAWACVFVGLRLGLGPHPAVLSLAEVFEQNFSSPMWWAYALAFFGALWVLPFTKWRDRPEELRRLLLLLVPYLLLQLAFGRVREVRLLLPLSLVLIPMTLDLVRSEMEHES